MIEILRLVVLDCAVVIAAAIGLVLVLRFGRAALDALPTSRARRVLIERVAPVAAVAIGVLFVATAVRWVLRTDDHRAWIAIAIVGGVTLALAWGALRDVIEGVLLRAARGCTVGDRIQLDAVRGRVERLGLRGLHVEATDGELVVVPYRAIAGKPIVRAPRVDHAAFRVFRVAVPAGRTVEDARRVLIETALLHHWASVARLPQVVVTEQGELEVTVFAIDAHRVLDVERALRRALAATS